MHKSAFYVASEKYFEAFDERFLVRVTLKEASQILANARRTQALKEEKRGDITCYKIVAYMPIKPRKNAENCFIAFA
ncbi:MAG: hypothetical protein ACP5IG_04810, partial [Candidatus Micrarchaeia archaeon]